MIYQALGGGMMIGAAAALLLAADGYIAGISGVLGDLVRRRVGPGGWRLAFVAGLLVAPLLTVALGYVSAEVHLQGGLAAALCAGLLTGIGTGYASGCTSGHGVCGLSNLSVRSLWATAIFMTVAAATVFVRLHLMGA